MMFQNLLHYLPFLVAGILVLGILVFVHELGHFLAAKWCGIRVLAFSLGFGNVLLKKRVGDTEYRLSAVPFGGYVHMAGENPEDESESAPDEFRAKPVWQRAIVAIAGPASNFVFSFLLLWAAFMAGIQKPQYLNRCVVGHVEEDSPAQRAGIQSGDSIVSINGNRPGNWEEIEKLLSLRSPGNEIVLHRDGAELSLELSFPRDAGGDLLGGPGMLPPHPAVIGDIHPSSPAADAGFREHDSIAAIDSVPVYSWYQVTGLVSRFDSTRQASLAFRIIRDGVPSTIRVRPAFDAGEERFLIGIGVAPPPSRAVRYAPHSAAVMAAKRSWEYTTMIFSVLRKLAAREVSPDQLVGPVGIVQLSGVIVLGGMVSIMTFMAMIGINLGIINLFPLIITDGGVLLFLLLESIRGRPLPLKYQLVINRIAVAFFIVLFIYITRNDIMRIPRLFRLTR